VNPSKAGLVGPFFEVVGPFYVGMGMSNWIKIDEKQGFMPGTPFCHSFGS